MDETSRPRRALSATRLDSLDQPQVGADTRTRRVSLLRFSFDVLYGAPPGVPPFGGGATRPLFFSGGRQEAVSSPAPSPSAGTASGAASGSGSGGGIFLATSAAIQPSNSPCSRIVM